MAEQTSKRLDIAVGELMPAISRSAASKLIINEKVSVNGKVIDKPSHKVSVDDTITIDYDISAQKIPDISLPVMYEDSDCLVIDKPAGVLTHSKGSFNPEATVATFIAPMLTGMSGGDRAGIVHRLDRMTSGVIICAKTQSALSWLQKQFSLRRTKKTYIAIVSGHLKEPEAVIDMPIERNPKAPATFRVGANGKSANTHYKVLKSSNKYDMIELTPETGRTHQLRVHMSHLGHPILGDTIYGSPQSDRLYLHAYKLELTLPNRERKIFISELPEEFDQIIKEDD